MTITISHWVNNKAYPGTGGNTSPVTNPATGEVTRRVALGSVEDARAALAMLRIKRRLSQQRS